MIIYYIRKWNRVEAIKQIILSLMEFNFFQLFILFGLLQGLLCLSILLGSSAIRSRSNLYLSFLIIAFVGNVGLYWIQDIGLISDTEMELFFLPWQMMVAPLFYLYVQSLKIFDQVSFRRWILFLPPILTLLIHFVIKFLILSQGIEQWAKPPWVSSFYLLEEVVSLAYCLVVTILVYRMIWEEKRRPNFNGFGLNSGIVSFIRIMLQMGLILAVIWMVSLIKFYDSSTNFQGYYVFWSAMVIALNIFGGAGIYYSLKEGGFARINLPPESNLGDKMTFLTPQKYVNPNLLESIINLNAQLADLNSVSKLQEQLKSWLIAEFDMKGIHFLSGKGNIEEKGKIVIPFASLGNEKKIIAVEFAKNEEVDEAKLYNLNMSIKAYAHHERRILNAQANEKITSDNKVYQSLLALFAEENLFTEPTLDLNLLASKLDVSAGYLSKVINDVSGKSFNEFINDYRVEKVKALMKDIDFSHYNVLGLGLEAGFNSKSTFYKAFQKREGVSPGKYYSSLNSVQS